MKHFLFFFEILFLLSCNNLKSDRINIEKVNSSSIPYLIDLNSNIKKEKSIFLSSIGTELEYIALETNPYSLIGENPQFGFTYEYIFVKDATSNRLLQFDRKGNFIKQIGAPGRGPGEYFGSIRFCIDQLNERIFIMSCWSDCKVMEFNFNGEYIRSFDQPWQSIKFLVYDSIGLIFEIADYSHTATGIIPGRRDFSFLDYNLYITDFKCNPLFKIKRHLMRKSNFEAGEIAFYLFENEIHFQQFGVDTLFTLRKDKLEPYSIFNLGKRKMDPSLIFTRYNHEEMKKKVQKDIWIRSILENKDNLFIKINLGLADSSKFCIFNKHTNLLTFLKENELVNDIDGGISFWPKYVYDDSIMIDYVEAYKMKNIFQKIQSSESKKWNDQFEKMKRNLTETSNPILVILK